MVVAKTAAVPYTHTCTAACGSRLVLVLSVSALRCVAAVASDRRVLNGQVDRVHKARALEGD
jgi:hypothetical protein